MAKSDKPAPKTVRQRRAAAKATKEAQNEALLRAVGMLTARAPLSVTAPGVLQYYPIDLPPPSLRTVRRLLQQQRCEHPRAPVEKPVFVDVVPQRLLDEFVAEWHQNRARYLLIRWETADEVEA